MKWRPRKPIPWDELAPPGMNGRKRWWGSVAALAVAVFWALSLFGDACSYEIKGYEHRIELYGAYGASFPINLFDDMLWPSLWGFWFALIIPPVQAVQNYQSHYRGSRSIYLMRRLPDRWELHRRCLILTGTRGRCTGSFTICSHKRRGQSCLRFPMCASPTAPTPL